MVLLQLDLKFKIKEVDKMATTLENIEIPENPSKATAEAGKDTLLLVAKGSYESPTWVLVGGQKNSPINRKASTLDGSHKTAGGWASSLPGVRSWSIDYSGLSMLNDEGVKILDYAFTQGKQVYVRIEYADGSYRTGWAFITAFNDDNASDAIATIKVTLEGNGAISDRIILEEATITPTTETFSKQASTDVNFTVTPTKTTVRSIVNNQTNLIADVDYTYSSGALVVKKEYLNKQPNGAVTLTVNTSTKTNIIKITVGE